MCAIWLSQPGSREAAGPRNQDEQEASQRHVFEDQVIGDSQTFVLKALNGLAFTVSFPFIKPRLSQVWWRGGGKTEWEKSRAVAWGWEDSPGSGFSCLRVLRSGTRWGGQSTPAGNEKTEGLACNNAVLSWANICSALGC